MMETYGVEARATIRQISCKHAVRDCTQRQRLTRNSMRSHRASTQTCPSGTRNTSVRVRELANSGLEDTRRVVSALVRCSKSLRGRSCTPPGPGSRCTFPAGISTGTPRPSRPLLARLRTSPAGLSGTTSDRHLYIVQSQYNVGAG